MSVPPFRLTWVAPIRRALAPERETAALNGPASRANRKVLPASFVTFVSSEVIPTRVFAIRLSRSVGSTQSPLGVSAHGTAERADAGREDTGFPGGGG